MARRQTSQPGQVKDSGSTLLEVARRVWTSLERWVEPEPMQKHVNELSLHDLWSSLKVLFFLEVDEKDLVAILNERIGMPEDFTWKVEYDGSGQKIRLSLQEPYPRIPNISLLDVRNFRGLEALTIRSLPADRKRAKWLILLGDNGTGKTTLLQSIAIALLRSNGITILAPKWTAGGPLVQIGSSKAEVELTTGGETFKVKILKEEQTKRELEFLEPKEEVRIHSWPVRPAVFGYGVFRDASPGSEGSNPSSDPAAWVGTLFDPFASLVNPVAWLRRIEGDANRARSERLASGDKVPSFDETFFEAVVSVLQRALGIKKLEVRRDDVWVDHPEQGEIPLSALSSGYYAFGRWLIDLLARWSDFNRLAGLPLSSDFNLHMRCLVLVDEIDLYLHPAWQRVVISDLRALFPETTFVVTTHNPLCLLGAEPGEIFVLRRDELTGAVEAEQRDLPPGIRPDEVLTGTWFGLQPSQTLDSDTTALLEKHRQLLRTVRGRRSARAAELEAELTRRLKLPFHSPAVRNLLWAASEITARQRQALDPLDTVSRMSDEELEALITKARGLMEGGE